MNDPYEALGVSRDASSEEIKLAFRKLAAKHHPDRKGGDAVRFTLIRQAHDILIDPKRRFEYDTTGKSDKAKDVDQLARSTIAQAFNQLLQDNEADPDFNYVKKLGSIFNSALIQLRANKKSVKRHVDRCEKLLHHTEGEVLQGVIQQRLSTCKAQLAQVEEQLATTKKSQQMIEGCRCGADLDEVCTARSSDRFAAFFQPFDR